MDTFKNRFNTIIRLRNIKPIELSEKTGIPKSAISQYMSGLYEPKQKNIYKLCKILDVSEPWLMGLDVPNLHSTIFRLLLREYSNSVIDKIIYILLYLDYYLFFTTPFILHNFNL